MNLQSGLTCVACRQPVWEDDGFCEACGAVLVRAVLTESRHEIDEGIVAGVTDVGSVRRRNEDALRIHSIDHAAFAVVCDGVASAAAGHLAAHAGAETASHVLRAALRSPEGERRMEPEAVMSTAMDAAQQAVLQVPWESGAESPACTWTSALWDGATITVGSVGDSRAYWITADEAKQLTVDDSWAQEQIDAGLMTDSAARRAPQAHAITRWLGADAPAGPFRVTSMRRVGRGRIVVCSDGLWQYTPTAAALAGVIASAPATTGSLAVARSLVDAALAAGGHDNITVAVIDIDIDIDID
jgi:serine/threonine protein phosphatase PrpC